MKTKKILKINRPLNNDIVSINQSPSAYVDHKYFIEYMDEDSNKDNYFVEVKGIKVEWLLKDKYGSRLLNTLQLKGGFDIFGISALQMIIEYFYLRLKIIIYFTVLPLYMLAHIFFEV